MRNYFLVVPRSVFIAGAVFVIFNYAFAYDNGDFQIWHTEVQEMRINEESKATLEEEFRFGDNANDFYYHHYDLGFALDLSKYLGLSVNYRQIYEKKAGKFKEENRPHLNAVVKWASKGFKFDDRQRFEYRHFDYQTDFWQYQNKLTIKFPWKVTKIEIQPYLADEIFVALNEGEVTRNRFYSGISLTLTKNAKAEIYYLLQRSKSSGKWANANVLGTKLKILF